MVKRAEDMKTGYIKRKDNTDRVEVHAQTITFEAKDFGSLTALTGDFEVHKTGESPALSELGHPEMRVEFDAWVSSGQAIGSLKKVIAHIEAFGLPKTREIVPRTKACTIEAAQAAVRDYNEAMAKLPVGLRNFAAKYFRSLDASRQGRKHD